MIPTTCEVLDHTADVKLRLRGPSFAAVAAEAGRALARLELGGVATAPSGAWHTIAIQAADRSALLVDWLNELIYRAESQRWVAAEFEVVAATDTALEVRARGVTVDATPSRVKAATFHGLRVAPIREGDGWEAEVVLDV